MNSELTYKLSKYFIQGVVIYLLFKYIPKEPMKDKDILLITSIVVLIMAVLESVQLVYLNPMNKQNQNVPTIPTIPQCSSQCSAKEHLESVSPQDNQSVNSTGSSNTAGTAVSATVTPSTATAASVTPSTAVGSAETKSEEDQNAITRNADGSYNIKPLKNEQAESIGSRSEDDVMGDELPYNFVDYHTLPVDMNDGSFESGYSMLPPKDWYPVPPHPPVCVTEKVCPVCPVYTSGTEVNLKEWNQTRRITPPDNINVNVIKEKLNSGR